MAFKCFFKLGAASAPEDQPWSGKSKDLDPAQRRLTDVRPLVASEVQDMSDNSKSTHWWAETILPGCDCLLGTENVLSWNTETKIHTSGTALTRGLKAALAGDIFYVTNNTCFPFSQISNHPVESTLILESIKIARSFRLCLQWKVTREWDSCKIFDPNCTITEKLFEQPKLQSK